MTPAARILVVTPNPAIDVTYEVGRQAVGEHVRVRRVTRVPGGKGVNVASVLAALGAWPTLVLPLGGDSGAWVASHLAGRDLDPHIVEVAAATRSTVVVVDGIQHPTMFTEPGEPLSESEVDELVLRVSVLAQSFPVVVISGSVPVGTTTEQVRRLVAAARSGGALVVVDTSGPALLAAADARADVVKPNAVEAVEATGAADLDGAVDALLRRGAQTVVVSMGVEGMVAVDGERWWSQPAVPAVRGNPTGAGDASTAAFALALAEGGSMADALSRAAVVGAAAVLQPVAGAIDRGDVATLQDAVPLGSQRPR